MQEAGAGVTTVTTPSEHHRTTPSTTALHMLATCDPPLLRPATCIAHCCRLILAFGCSRSRFLHGVALGLWSNTWTRFKHFAEILG